MKFSKLRDNSGSAMLLAIFLVVIVSIIIISFSIQVGNQVKSTMKADEDIQEKYDRESEIENSIGKFIEGINIRYMDDIYKQTGVDKDNKPIYDQYIYYKIEYSKEVYYQDISISNDIENKYNDGGITIFYKKIPVTSIKSGGTIKSDPNFDSYDRSKGTVFTLDFKESKNNKRSQIYINIKNISGEKKSEEKCDINYEVKSWRS